MGSVGRVSGCQESAKAGAARPTAINVTAMGQAVARAPTANQVQRSAACRLDAVTPINARSSNAWAAYITRPAIANERLKRNRAGQVVLQLKSPWRDGTTHIVMSPLDLMQRFAALVPRPRLHVIRSMVCSRRAPIAASDRSERAAQRQHRSMAARFLERQPLPG